MRTNRLGSTGLIVSELCLGTLTFGKYEGPLESVAGLDLPAATKLLKRALDAGINIIDTANVYANGGSEEIVGQALRSLGVRRAEIVIASKVASPMGPGVNEAGTSRYHILDQIDQSLRRLGLSHVDLYQIHGWDELTPMEETLRALDDIVRSGRARYIGVSNWAAWQMAKALGICDRLGLHDIAATQAYYTLAARDIEREVLPMLRSEGLGLLVYSPLAGGVLSGKYTRGASGQLEGDGRRTSFDFPPVNFDRAFGLIEVMREVASRKGVTVAQIAIAWLLHQPAVTSVIIGAKRMEQLDDNLASCEVELDAADLEQLAKASALPGEYPGWMIDFFIGGRQAAVSPRRGSRAN